MLRLVGCGCAERGRDISLSSSAPSAQDLYIHNTEIPFWFELVRRGPQMPDLHLTPMAPHKAAHVGFGPAIPKFALRVLPVPSSKKHKTATKPTYLRSADASADPCPNPFWLLLAEHWEGDFLGGHHVAVLKGTVLMLNCRGWRAKGKGEQKK